MNTKNMTIKEIQEALKNGGTSCREIVSNYQKVIEEKNNGINAYLEVFDDAFATAEDQDKKIASGEMLKPLTGAVFAIKDNILIKGRVSSASSKILENYHAAYDATVIKKLREAGAIFLGRTNMDEFAMGSSTESSAFGVTKNPHDLRRVAGGSSGGSAASVAMNSCVASLGTDTGGSIRQPAAFCGVVGLKPTYGAVSRYGAIAMASSLDQIGPITKNVEDAETIFNIIKGKDLEDGTSTSPEDIQKEIPAKLKIGVLKYDKEGVDGEVNKTIDSAVESLKKLGHEIVEVELPLLKYSLPCYYIIMPAEVSSNLARYDGIRYGFSKDAGNLLDEYLESRGEGFGRETRRRVMLGTYVLSAGYYDAYYLKAQKVRALVKKDFQTIFNGENKVDAILLPTTPSPAFKIGEKTSDPVSMYLEDIFTVSSNLAGIPAISVPAGLSKDGLPLSVQFFAPWFREDILFALGKQYENTINS